MPVKMGEGDFDAAKKGNGDSRISEIWMTKGWREWW